MPELLQIDTLDDFRRLLGRLPEADGEAAASATRRQRELLKPPGALGRLEALAVWLAAWQGRAVPRADKVWALVFAGNHGVARRGVSAYPPAVTRQMVVGFHQGRAAVNQLCATFGIDLEVFPLDLDRPTADFVEGPAMDEAEVVEALNAGLRAGQDREADALCLGEMGIANTTAAAALAHALFGGAPQAWVGGGAGVAAEGFARKVAAVAAGAARHRRETSDGLELLRRLGGRELAAIAGAVAGARLARIPVVLDGYTATAAAAALAVVAPGALDHVEVGHRSAEPGHRLLLRRLGKAPLLQMDMRLGEASGAVLAAALLRAACACHAGMATFAEAGVDGPGPDAPG